MTSYVSQVSKSSLVKGFVCILGNLTTPVRALEAALWIDAEAIRGDTPEPEDEGGSRQKCIDRAKHRVMRKAPEWRGRDCGEVPQRWPSSTRRNELDNALQ